MRCSRCGATTKGKKCHQCGNKNIRKHGKQQASRYIYNKRSRTKKRAISRGMGFFMLNSPFHGSDGHHIDDDTIIFIPRYIHRNADGDEKETHRANVLALLAEAGEDALLELCMEYLNGNRRIYE